MQYSFLFTLLFCCNMLVSAQSNLYFPPSNGVWQTMSPNDLGYCPERIDSLYQFLSNTKTRGFILLKDGKIVLERYFGTATQDSVWYWASSGKSLSAYLMGIAMEQNGVDPEAPVSTYLGAGWSVVPPDKEILIKVKHLLSMSSGLDDVVQVPGVADPDNCTQPKCLVYKADPGTRWAYHNAPYYLCHNILEKVSNTTLNLYTKTRLFDKIGAKGLWVNHVMYSTPRSMARFGLLALAEGRWGTDTLLSSRAYVQAMRTTSQNLNKSYGYLWWLNGQQSFMLPDIQLVFPGPLCKSCPPDMYAALGKNDQKIHVIPSKGIVLVRMGDASGIVGPNGNNVSVPILFDDALWRYVDALNCSTINTEEVITKEMVQARPNPTNNYWQITLPDSIGTSWQLLDMQGRIFRSGRLTSSTLEIDASELPEGMYLLKTHKTHIKLMRQ